MKPYRKYDYQWEGFPIVEPLRIRHTMETLAFLSKRPLHTVGMAGFILQNGIESSFNRGEFYGCRNTLGQLEGVALIGHATLFEARTQSALSALVRQARECPSVYLVMGEQERVEQFWDCYAVESEEPRLVCRTVLMEQTLPAQDFGSAPELRLATRDDLEMITKANAEIILREHGLNPLERDPEGFRLRCARKIERGRTWVWTDKSNLLFKADVAAETPAVTYLEGIYVCPDAQSLGYGRRGMSQLAKNLEGRTKALCGLVEKENTRARVFYEKVGYRVSADYATFFLNASSAKDS